MKVLFSLTAVLAFTATGLLAADTLSFDQQEMFLKSAKIKTVKDAKKGVTGTFRATLTDGKITHDASIQTIDEHQAIYQTSNGSTELNFKDTYVFNIAGYKMAKLLGIADMVPVSVGRTYQGKSASFTWWIDDFMMDEGDRQAKKMQAPDQETWNREIQVMHVFDELIYNNDSNATNLLIDSKWHIYLIDHSRSFRMQKTLHDPKMLEFCDRSLLAKMKALDMPTLQKEMKGLLNKNELEGLLARRDLIVKFFESKGDSALYDRPSRS